MKTSEKKLTATFSEQNLEIKFELSSNTFVFLDITLDLQINIYHPFRKDNAKEIYINLNSNHPPNIKRELLSMIQRRLSYLSKNKHVFDELKTPYQTALRISGF